METLRRTSGVLAWVAIGLIALSAQPLYGASAAQLNKDATAALNKLYRSQPSAKILAQKARGILIFPSMAKAGFMFGGQIGEGVLRKGGRPVGYYNSVAASYGFQAGIQTFGYALFFMSDSALQQLDSTHGFELGSGPSLVILDEGRGKSITSSTLTSDVYAFIFNQRGLMGGAGIQGSKITKIDKR
jgi:lipid-binding SYLF domain-containing protein